MINRGICNIHEGHSEEWNCGKFKVYVDYSTTEESVRVEIPPIRFAHRRNDNFLIFVSIIN